ncbi:MAG: tetratricopeptide repeat protein [Dysgonomonas sp.]
MIKKIFLLFLLIINITLQAQENKTRAESMAAMAMGKEAEGGSLEEVSIIFSEAVKISPDFAELYAMWGSLIMKYAVKEKNLDLFGSCFAKLEKAIELKPDYPETYHFWGICLAYYGHEKKDDNIVNQSFAKFEKAVELNPSYSEGYLSWASTLLGYAQQKKDDPLYYKECIQKYDKALEYSPESIEANSGRGYAYLKLGHLEKDLVQYRPQLETSFLKAEQLGDQSAAYNLACYYSLIKEKDEAVKWLEKTIVKNYSKLMGTRIREKIEQDDDFKNIRREKKYKEIMDRYFDK